MDNLRIPNIIRFVRLKRGITVDELAQKVSISPTYIRSLENGNKSYVETTRMVLWALGVSPEVMNDMGMYHWMAKYKSLAEINRQVLFCGCCVLDAYLYSLSEKSAKELIKCELVNSYHFFQKLEKIPPHTLKKIFMSPIDGSVLAHILRDGSDGKDMNNKILESCVQNDIFEMLVKELGIEIINPFRVIHTLEEKTKKMRFLYASTIEKKKKEIENVISAIETITQD